MSQALSVEEARSRVLDAVTPLGTSEVLLRDALGLVLAADAVAPHDLPRFANSAMDGYTVRASDVADASSDQPSRLEVIGEVRAGDPGDLTVAPGTAARIMTGAPVPSGADAIVKVEDTSESDGYVLASATVSGGMHVRPAGDDIKAGTVVVSTGAELGPGELAVLASMGLSPITVRRGPKVALLVTGDELVDPEAQPGPGQIRDSNSVALSALIREAGGELIPLGRIEDKRDAVRGTRSNARPDLPISSCLREALRLGATTSSKKSWRSSAPSQCGGLRCSPAGRLCWDKSRTQLSSVSRAIPYRYTLGSSNSSGRRSAR